MSSLRRAWARVLAVLAGCLGALGLAELAVRLLDLEPQVEVVYREIYQLSENPVLEYELKPGAPDGPTRINSQGFRDREFERARPPGVFRIVVVGDSVTYGRRDEPHETYPKHLERQLNERSTGLCFEVLNLGVHGYNVTRIAERLRILGLAFQPDLVLYGYVLNDPQKNSLERAALVNLQMAEQTRLSATLQRRALRWVASSRLFLLLAGLLQSRAPPDPGAYLRPQHPRDVPVHVGDQRGGFFRSLHQEPESQQRLFEGLDRIASMTREAGVPVVAAIFPLLYLVGEAGYPLLDVNAFLDRELHARGFEVIDLLPYFEQAERDGLDGSADALHPNGAGNALAASALLERMVALELLPAGSIDVERPGGSVTR